MAMRIVYLSELETTIFPLLSLIVQLVDGLKRKVEARKESVKAILNYFKLKKYN